MGEEVYVEGGQPDHDLRPATDGDRHKALLPHGPGVIRGALLRVTTPWQKSQSSVPEYPV